MPDGAAQGMTETRTGAGVSLRNPAKAAAIAAESASRLLHPGMPIAASRVSIAESAIGQPSMDSSHRSKRSTGARPVLTREAFESDSGAEGIEALNVYANSNIRVQVYPKKEEEGGYRQRKDADATKQG